MGSTQHRLESSGGFMGARGNLTPITKDCAKSSIVLQKRSEALKCRETRISFLAIFMLHVEIVELMLNQKSTKYEDNPVRGCVAGKMKIE